MTEQTIVLGACVGATALMLLWFAQTILGMRDNLRDVHGAIFDRNDRPGALTRIDKHDELLSLHGTALRVHGMLSDE